MKWGRVVAHPAPVSTNARFWRCIVNEQILAEMAADLERPELDWWHTEPTDAEIEEMARRYEEEAWGRLVIESDAADHGCWEVAA